MRRGPWIAVAFIDSSSSTRRAGRSACWLPWTSSPWPPRAEAADAPRLRPMRIVSVGEAVAGIRSGDQIFVHGGAATPTPLLVALTGRAAELRDVKVVHFHTEGPAPHLA